MFLECKQCGGQVPVEEGKGVAACPYCGSVNTVGKSASTQGGLVNRANYLRRNNEFDKAAAVYEELLKADNTDYEAHWGSVLCKFGIEYVDDPASGERKPTCHRTIADAIFADPAYRAALEYAPLDVREVYEREAAQIDRIQKDIIALSQREEKFDVFLCYKELDEAGNRTQDSVIAQELEFELSRRGYRVFFARKTLERVLGSAYEPVIYAALQSARAMVVLGTKPEHFQAVWVRNEWSRYRELIRQGAQKMLIPAYRGMSPYDLPMELSNLQALDMGKLGFVQDLCDGIDRFTRVSRAQLEPAAAATIPQGAAAPGTEALIKRAFLFIEEGNIDRANAYIERVLDINPEEPRAYLAKLLIDLNIRSESQLKLLNAPLDAYGNYQKAVRFACGDLKERYLAINKAIVDGIEETKRKEAEKEEKRKAQAAAEAEKRRAEEAALAEKRRQQQAEADRVRAIRRKKAGKFHAIFWPSLLAVTFLIILITLNANYQKGISLIEAGEYKEAIARLEPLKGYRDADEKLAEAIQLEQQERYDWAETLMENGSYAAAIEYFTGLGEFRDASDRLHEAYYQKALTLYQFGKHEDALTCFLRADGYLDTDEYLSDLAIAYYHAGDYGNALLAWQGGGNKTAADSNEALELSAFQDRLRHSFAADYHALVLLSDGTVLAAGNNDQGECDVSDWRDIVAVAAGSSVSVGLRTNGTVVGKGNNDFGQLNVSKWRNITQIAAGNSYTVGLKSDGTLVSAGNNDIGQSDVSSWKNVKQICANSGTTFGLCEDGTVLSTGSDEYGRRNVSGWTNIVQISPAFDFTAGLKQDGTIVVTDTDELRNCSTWTDIVQIAAGHFFLAGLKRDGTVVLDGGLYWGQGEARNWTGIVALYADDNRLAGVKSDGLIVSISDTGNNFCDIPHVILW